MATEISIKLYSCLHSNRIRYYTPGSEMFSMVFENAMILSKMNLVTIGSLDFSNKFLNTEMKLGDYGNNSDDCKKESVLK